MSTLSGTKSSYYTTQWYTYIQRKQWKNKTYELWIVYKRIIEIVTIPTVNVILHWCVASAGSVSLYKVFLTESWTIRFLLFDGLSGFDPLEVKSLDLTLTLKWYFPYIFFFKLLCNRSQLVWVTAIQSHQTSASWRIRIWAHFLQWILHAMRSKHASHASNI